MKDLKNLLEKYLSIKPTDGIVKEAVIKALEEVCAISLSKEDISYTRNTVFLSIPPSYRIKVKQNRERLLEALPLQVRKIVDSIE